MVGGTWLGLAGVTNSVGSEDAEMELENDD